VRRGPPRSTPTSARAPPPACSDLDRYKVRPQPFASVHSHASLGSWVQPAGDQDVSTCGAATQRVTAYLADDRSHAECLSHRKMQ
jgi:hypothetical protein